MNLSTLLFLGLGGMELMLLILIPLGMTVWALIDVIRRDFEKDINKLVWIIVILFMPMLGGILYFFVGQSKKF